MTTLFLHVRDYDDFEFWFDSEPASRRVPTLTVEFADGFELTKTKHVHVNDAVCYVPPRGKGWQLVATAPDHSCWRRVPRRRLRVVYDGRNAQYVYRVAKRFRRRGSLVNRW